MENENELLKIGEVAKILRCSKQTLYNTLRPNAPVKHPLRVKRIGRLLRIKRADLNSYIDSLGE